MEEQERANQFALPGKQNSVVNIRKSSIIMSGAVIKEIMGDALDDSRMEGGEINVDQVQSQTYCYKDVVFMH